LLRAIFGEKASDVKDTSLRVKGGMIGTVIDVQVFTRDGVERDQRSKDIERMALAEFRKDLNAEYRIVEDTVFERMKANLVGQSVAGGPSLKKGDTLGEDYLTELPREDWFKLRMQDEALAEMLEKAEAQPEEERIRKSECAHHVHDSKINHPEHDPRNAMNQRSHHGCIFQFSSKKAA
jgi:DNA-directed RNA polymerase subunit beta